MDDKTAVIPPVAILVFVAVFFFLLYAVTSSSTVQGLDSGEYITLAVNGGVAHPPGYPLYIMACHIAQSVIPFGTPAFKVSMVSAFCGALTLLFISIASLLISNSVFHGILTASLIGFTPLFWTYATIQEVFTGATMVFAAITAISILILTVEIVRPWMFALLGFAWAVGVAHHHTVIFTAPMIITAMVRTISQGINRRSVACIVIFCVCGAAGFLPYLTLISSSSEWSWKTITSIRDLFDHFTRREYGTFQLTSGKTPAGAFENPMHLIGVLIDQFNVGIVVLFVASIFALRSFSRRTLMIVGVLFLTFVVAGPVFSCLMGIKPIGFSRFIVERFYLSPLVIIALIIGTVIHAAIQRFFTNRFRIVLFIIAMLLCALNGMDQIRSSRWTVLEDYVNNCFKFAPENSIIILKSDSEFGGFLSMQYVMHQREDIVAIAPPLFRSSWYYERLRKKHPDLMIEPEQFMNGSEAENIALLRMLNPRRQLFLTPSFCYDTSVQQRFPKIIPYKAVLLKVIPEDSTMENLHSLEKEQMRSWKQCSIISFPRSEKEAKRRVEYDVYLNYSRTFYYLAKCYQQRGDSTAYNRTRQVAIGIAKPWLIAHPIQ